MWYIVVKMLASFYSVHDMAVCLLSCYTVSLSSASQCCSWWSPSRRVISGTATHSLSPSPFPRRKRLSLTYMGCRWLETMRVTSGSFASCSSQSRPRSPGERSILYVTSSTSMLRGFLAGDSLRRQTVQLILFFCSLCATVIRLPRCSRHYSSERQHAPNADEKHPVQTAARHVSPCMKLITAG